MDNPKIRELSGKQSEKHKKPFFLIIIFFLLFLPILGGVFFALKGAGGEKTTITPSPTPFLPPADPNIKVDLQSTGGGREVILKIADFPDNVTSIEYELTYTTQTGLPRGVLGTIRVETKSNKLERLITLGTCSSGKCVYDENVKKITVTLKFNAASGASRFQKEFIL